MTKKKLIREFIGTHGSRGLESMITEGSMATGSQVAMGLGQWLRDYILIHRC